MAENRDLDLNLGTRLARMATGLAQAKWQIPGFFIDLATMTPGEEYDNILELTKARAIARGAAFRNFMAEDAQGWAALFHGDPVVVRAAKTVGRGYNWLVEDFGGEAIREPLSTALLVPQVAASQNANFPLFDTDTVRFAREMAKDVSVGQSMFFLLSNTDVMDEQQMANWVDTDFFNYATGTMDATVRLFLDPDILLFRGFGKARRAYLHTPVRNDPRRAMQLDRYFGSRRARQLDDWIDNLPNDRTEAARIIKGRVFGKDVRGHSKSYFLAEAPDGEARKAIWKVLYGDLRGLQDLRDLDHLHDVARQRASFLDELRSIEPIEGAARIFHPYQARARADRIAALESQLEKTVINQSNAFSHLTPSQQIDAKFRWLNDEKRARLLDAELSDTLRSVANVETLKSLTQSQETLLRLSKSGAVKEAIANSTFYQKSPYTKPVRVIHEKRPHRIIDIEDDNVVEMAARVMRQAQMGKKAQNDFISQLASQQLDAPTKALVWDRMNIAAMRSIIARTNSNFGTNITEEMTDQILREARRGTGMARKEVQKQYATGGRDIIRIETDQGIDVVRAPLFRSQTPNVVFAPDFNGIRKTLERYASKGYLPMKGETVGTWAAEVADGIIRYWKASVLIRGAWPVRVTGFDEIWRLFAKYGAWEAGPAVFRRGTRNFTRAVARDLGLDDPARAGRAGAVTGGVMGLALGGATGAGLGAAGGFVGFRVLNNLANLERAGVNWSRLHKTGIAPPFGEPGDLANVIRDRVSSKTMFTRLMDEDTHYGALMRQIEARDPRRWETIKPEDARHLPDWEWAVNNQLRGDQLAERIMAGETHQDLVKWLRSPDGVRYQRGMFRGDREIQDPDTWVKNARAMVDDLFPGDAGPQLRTLALERPLKTADFLRYYPDEASRPHVTGEAIQDAFGRSLVADRIDSFIERSMKILGQFPTDELVRFPGFEVAYKRYFERLLDANYPTWRSNPTGLSLTPQRISELQDAARRQSLAEMRDLVYDLGERSELHHLLRHIHPFLPAVQEVASTWTGLALNNPVFATRAVKLWFSLDNIEDISWESEEGDKFLVFPIPERARGLLSNSPIFSEALDDQGFVRIPKQGFNLILQSPFGLGPFVQASVSEVLRHKPLLEDDLQPLMDIFMPYGPNTSFWDAWLPTWGRRALAPARAYLRGRDSDRDYYGLWMRSWGMALADMREGRRDWVDFDSPESVEALEEEVTTKTNALFALRAFSAFFSPAQPIFESPLWMHEQALRQMIEHEQTLTPAARTRIHVEHGTPIERMMDAYGDEIVFVLSSMSRSHDGVPPDLEALHQREQWSDLVERYPEFGGFIIGRDSDIMQMEFSRAVYDYQLKEPVRPGDSRTQRELVSPRELYEDSDERIGWKKWTRANDFIEAERISRGLPNLRVAEARDLAALRARIRDQIGAEHPEWLATQQEEITLPKAKWDKKVKFFREIINHPDERLRNRPDVLALKEYLSLRDRFVLMLRERDDAGGAATLEASSNFDLQILYETEIARLLEDNIHFGPVYFRHLEHDRLSAEDGR